MSKNSWREKNRHQRNGQAGDLAGTTVQNLWNRSHGMPCLSERQNVQGGVVAPLSLQQPLAFRRSSMNQANTIYPASCENDTRFPRDPYGLKSSITPYPEYQRANLSLGPYPLLLIFISPGPAVFLMHILSSSKNYRDRIESP